MPRKICLKKLTASDLTFFEWHFRYHNAGNQKAINLNSDVFVDQLYPSLPELTVESGGRIPIDLSVFGPGIKGLHNLQRKIVKFGSYKNWRLNGEFIYNPDNDIERYNQLIPGDFGLFEFIGGAVPSAANLFLVANGVDADAKLHALLGNYLQNRSMAVIPSAALGNLVAQAELDVAHPTLRLTFDSELEDAALGGFTGRRRLYAHSQNRQISKDDLQHARNRADETGRNGEELVNSHFSQAMEQGRLTSIEWTAQVNAVAPYDFKIVSDEYRTILLDVKTTAGEFERPIHISFNEILQIANGLERFDIYRVYEASMTGGKLRIASDIKDFGKTIFKALSGLPDGVTADGVSISPTLLKFSESIELTVDGLDDSQV